MGYQGKVVGPAGTPDQQVRDWVKHNLGLVRLREDQVYRALWRIGARITASFRRDLSADVLDSCIHDAMVDIRENRDLLNMQNPTGYYCTAVKRKCLDQLRYQRVRPAQQGKDFEDGTSWESGLVAEIPDLQVLLEHEDCFTQVLSRLNAAQRDNLKLALDKRVHGESAQDLALKTGRQPAAVTEAVSNFVKKTLLELIEEVCPGLYSEVTGRRL